MGAVDRSCPGGKVLPGVSRVCSVDVGLQNELFGDEFFPVAGEVHHDNRLEGLALEPGGVFAVF